MLSAHTCSTHHVCIIRTLTLVVTRSKCKQEPDDHGLGAPTGNGGGGGLAGAGGLGGGISLPFQGVRGKSGCDGIRCGHVARGSENG